MQEANVSTNPKSEDRAAQNYIKAISSSLSLFYKEHFYDDNDPRVTVHTSPSPISPSELKSLSSN
jgi:hypothetical protein